MKYLSLSKLTLRMQVCVTLVVVDRRENYARWWLEYIKVRDMDDNEDVLDGEIDPEQSTSLTCKTHKKETTAKAGGK